ncbi:MAG: hypothetical protein L6Q71_06900 [Planctomycetes bacterium]|nr:hypothetical protein [Planctomycetota bacterium]NUQ35432.1 hypothetical protein [Planctomycetaceae bacterium]
MNEQNDSYEERLKALNERVIERASRVPGWMTRWDEDGAKREAQPIGARLLKAQGTLARDLLDGGDLHRIIRNLAILALLTAALYGAVIGSFSGPQQALYAALKFPLVMLGSALICLPSFYVFQCLVGARPSLLQACAAVLLMTTASGLILFGCAPIAWFFTISSEADAGRFLVALHVIVVAAALIFGMNLLSRMRRFFDWKQANMFSGRVLMLWNVLFVVVVLQMAYFLGPLMVSEDIFLRGERGLFIKAIGEFFTGSN